MSRTIGIAITLILLVAGCGTSPTSKQSPAPVKQTKAVVREDLSKPKMYDTILTCRNGDVKLKLSAGLLKREFTAGQVYDDSGKNCWAVFTITNLSGRPVRVDNVKVSVARQIKRNGKLVMTDTGATTRSAKGQTLENNETWGMEALFDIDKPGAQSVICGFQSTILETSGIDEIMSSVEYKTKPIACVVKPRLKEADPKLLSMTAADRGLDFTAVLPVARFVAGTKYKIKATLINNGDKAITIKTPFAVDVIIREAHNASAEPEITPAPTPDAPGNTVTLAKGIGLNYDLYFSIKKPGTYTVFCGAHDAGTYRFKSSFVTIVVN